MADVTLNELLRQAQSKLRQSCDSPAKEAQLLLAHTLGISQLELITRLNEHATFDLERFFGFVKRRAAHEPMEYITNGVSFFSQEFYIDRRALIPRPETELLIEHLLRRIERESDACIVEVGAGSGVVSIVLAQHLPNARFIAVDISEAALEVAKINRERFGLAERIELRQSDLFENVSERFDILVSNPPYIAEDAPLERNLSYEPQNALFGGRRGDELIRELIDFTCKRDFVRLFGCEMGYDQKERVQNYLANRFTCKVDFYKDYANFDRGFIIEK